MSPRRDVMSSLLWSIRIRTFNCAWIYFKLSKTGDTRSKNLGTRQEGTTCSCKKVIRLLATPIYIHVHTQVCLASSLGPSPPRRSLVHMYDIFSVKNGGYYPHAQTVCTRSLLRGKGRGLGMRLK